MKDLWPGDNDFGDVFDARQDPHSGKAIEDKYGFISFGTGVALTRQFPSLGMSGWELLPFIDREEYQRVRDATTRRAALRRRRNQTPPDGPEWLIHDTVPLSDLDEEAALERARLTLEKAKELVAPTGQ